MTIAEATLVAACERAWRQPEWSARPAILTVSYTHLTLPTKA